MPGRRALRDGRQPHRLPRRRRAVPRRAAAGVAAQGRGAPARRARQALRFDAVVVDRLSLTVARGELLVLLGGSGSGKTTTLKMVNRLIEPDARAGRIDGGDAATLRAARAAPPDRLLLPAGRALPAPDGRRERRHHAARCSAGSATRIDARVDELLDAGRARRRARFATAARASSRAASSSASASRARSRAEPERAAARRAVRRARSADARPAAAVVPRASRASSALTAVFVTHDMVEALAARRPHRRAATRAGSCRSARRPSSCARRPTTTSRDAARDAAPPGRALGACSTRDARPSDVSEQLALLPELPHGAPRSSRSSALAARHRDQRAARRLGRRAGPRARGARARRRRASIQTIPGLALLAVMVPVLAALGASRRARRVGVPSIGFLPGAHRAHALQRAADPAEHGDRHPRRRPGARRGGARRRHDRPRSSSAASSCRSRCR